MVQFSLIEQSEKQITRMKSGLIRLTLFLFIISLTNSHLQATKRIKIWWLVVGVEGKPVGTPERWQSCLSVIEKPAKIYRQCRSKHVQRRRHLS